MFAFLQLWFSFLSCRFLVSLASVVLVGLPMQVVAQGLMVLWSPQDEVCSIVSLMVLLGTFTFPSLQHQYTKVNAANRPPTPQMAIPPLWSYSRSSTTNFVVILRRRSFRSGSLHHVHHSRAFTMAATKLVFLVVGGTLRQESAVLQPAEPPVVLLQPDKGRIDRERWEEFHKFYLFWCHFDFLTLNPV